MMSAALKLPPPEMTVPEFLDWADVTPGLWQLRDGEPELMAPPAETHATIHSYFGFLLTAHLELAGGRCRVLTGPGVVPRLWSETNMLIPDLAITCQPPAGGRAIAEPLVLVEILSPSNERQTRANIWAFATIPSVVEMVVIDSRKIAAEVMRRSPAGEWPQRGELVGPDGMLRIAAIDFQASLRAVYRTTVLGS